MTGSTFVLVPGAWMGAWIWADMVDRLRAAGHEAVTSTLSGLTAGTPHADVARVGLDDHVRDVVELLAGLAAERVVLVGHSYSGLVVGQVADQVPERIARVVQVAAFLPRDGRSLLDDWGSDAGLRAEERRQVADDGMVWAPPPGAALAMEPDLSDSQRAWLGERFTPHPGRCVLDPAVLSRPVTEQPTTFVATAPAGEDALAEAPPEVADAPSAWRVETLTSGHWPMVSVPDELQRLLEASSG